MRHLNSWEIAPRKGGSSGTSTTTSSSGTTLNEDFKPTVDRGLAELESLFGSGALGQVAGLSDTQNMVFDAAPDALDAGMDAMGEARGTYRDAMGGTGLFDETDVGAIKQAQINQAKKEMGIMDDKMASSGLMGSSRAQIVEGDFTAQLADALAQTEYGERKRVQDNAMWGADSMMGSGRGEADLLGAYSQLGEVERGIDQEMLDSDAKGLENYLAGMQVFTPLMTKQTSESETQQQSTGGK